uniref:phospholipase A2 hemilipin isoform X1 n=1 Tax=Vespula vulgaris TaxID=7454 RepID=UPI0021372FD0|nr:phospholipase A2 hemilipin isoform X1 [Vespula vulgaris]XP_050860652.1 phospholipase A2 hemilipin isoform X1 [Vespula vulgaris]XP_050860653.1 phospholipase A2 hemilipin isoform X1 [Vespula vulgaris]
MLTALFCILSILWIQKTMASVLVADTTMSRMVELNAGEPICSLYNDRGVIQKMIFGADPKKVRQMPSNLVADLEETCLASKENNRTPGGGLIYPGTKWCGPGNVAASYNDLGHHAAEDACCREHDHCPIAISSQQCIHGICNNSPFTRSHCDCDAKFRRCLQNLNTEVANTIGALFFNVIQVTCFKERRPCSEWQRSSEKCIPYWKQSPSYEPLDFDKRKEIGKSNKFLYQTPFSKFVEEVLDRLKRVHKNVMNYFQDR